MHCFINYSQPGKLLCAHSPSQQHDPYFVINGDKFYNRQ